MCEEGPDPIEHRIARWMKTGEGEDMLLREISDLIEAQRNRLAARFGGTIGHDAIDEGGLTHVWKALVAKRYDPLQRFSPWLSTVLRNLCLDTYRQKKRGARPFALIRGAASNPDDPDVADTIDDQSESDSQDLLGRALPEIERLLKPDERLIFALASGVADQLDSPQVDRWCAEASSRPEFRTAIDALFESPSHGRLEILAGLLEIRPATCRKRFQRAVEKLRVSATLSRLLGGDGRSP